jgi:hypothetical protein
MGRLQTFRDRKSSDDFKLEAYSMHVKAPASAIHSRRDGIQTRHAGSFRGLADDFTPAHSRFRFKFPRFPDPSASCFLGDIFARCQTPPFPLSTTEYTHNQSPVPDAKS